MVSLDSLLSQSVSSSRCFPRRRIETRLIPLRLLLSFPFCLTAGPRAASILLWTLVFGCKFVESYFFLTLSFKDPIRVMTGMKIQGCSDKYFGNALCTNQAAFTLAIMFVMDLSLFFLDTFLW